VKLRTKAMNQAQSKKQAIRAATDLVNPGRQIEDDLELGPDQPHGILPPPAATEQEQGNSITPVTLIAAKGLRPNPKTQTAKDKKGPRAFQAPTAPRTEPLGARTHPVKLPHKEALRPPYGHEKRCITMAPENPSASELLASSAGALDADETTDQTLAPRDRAHPRGPSWRGATQRGNFWCEGGSALAVSAAGEKRSDKPTSEGGVRREKRGVGGWSACARAPALGFRYFGLLEGTAGQFFLFLVSPAHCCGCFSPFLSFPSLSFFY
jgi:hypothetical protein